MLAVVATAVGCFSVLLVETSIFYYRHPGAPAWLRSRPNLQTTISTLFGCGVLVSVGMFVRYFLDSAFTDLRFGEIGLIAGLLAGFFGLFRAIQKRGSAPIDSDKVSNSVVALGAFSGCEPKGAESSRSLPRSNDREAA